MEKTIVKSYTSYTLLKSLGLTCLGTLILVLGSMVKIPFYPISFTLQTFAVFLLALTMSPKQAFSSVCGYLLIGSLGLPVFCSNAASFWLIGKSGGYLIAFPIAAYITAKIAAKSSPLIAVLCGNLIIYIGGFTWLSFFLGPYLAFIQGVLLFLPSDFLKSMMALGLASSWNRWSLN